MTRPRLLSCLLLCVLLASTACSKGEDGAQGVGTAAVWPSGGANSELLPKVQQQCTAPDVRTVCVAQFMQQNGATTEAVDFFQKTGWFLIGYRPMGKVGLGNIFLPWRANALKQYVLVTGSMLIYVEDEGAKLNLQNDPAYPQLAAAFPPQANAPASSANVIIFPADNGFESSTSSPQGGQRFVFQYNVVNVCHACGTGFQERVAFDFDKNGHYQSASLIGLCRSTAPADKLSAIAACPTTSP